MLHTKLPLEDTKAFTPFFLDYIRQKESLKPFYHSFPSPDNFNNLLTIKGKAFPQANRAVLQAALAHQYRGLKPSEKVRANIAALADPGTFTVTTGHQLNIFTGPLYFIFKIVTVINTCRSLKEKYPQCNFVPVYWMASEDHDYDEIKYFRLYGKKYVWETDQHGAVGRFDTKGIENILNEVPGDTGIFREAYQKNRKLSDAVRHYVNSLFGQEGLIALDADDRNLKLLFRDVMKEDILQNTTFPMVEKTNKQLETLGYEPQIFCRDINFFYLEDQVRSRIEKDGDRYKVLDTSLVFSGEEMAALIESNPEKFSPNVILRPLYQEMILPNLAYVGGPAELVYWLQLKNVFEHHRVPFPILMPRNFGMIVDHPLNRKFEKTGLEMSILFEPKNYIFNHWVLKNTKHDMTVGQERATVETTFRNLQGKASSIDHTLAAFVGAEGRRALNSLEKIEKKMLRAEKRLHADRLRQIEEVKDTLFPGTGLQERVDNFLNFYQQDDQFIGKLIHHFDPFDFSFNILTYGNR